MANFLLQHNFSPAACNYLGSLFFPYSKIAGSCASRCNKTAVIINETFATHCLNYPVEHC